MSRRIPPHVASAGVEALATGWLTMGPRTQQLESAMAERFGCEHVIATSSGTAALHLTLLAAGVARGGSVLIPDLAPASCAGAVEACGALPQRYPLAGLDSLPDLDDSSAPSPAAVIARHHLGFPVDLGSLRGRCAESGVALVEDRRESLGAEHGDGGVGGSAAIVSFSSRRPISCGEGGAVLTDDDDVAEVVRSLRSHAMTSGSWDRHRGHAETYDVIGVGFNYRIDEIRAAMAEAALADLAGSVERRRALAREAAAVAADLGGRAPAGELIARAAPIALPVLADSAASRDDLAAGLADRGLRSEPPRVSGGDALSSRLLIVVLPESD